MHDSGTTTPSFRPSTFPLESCDEFVGSRRCRSVSSRQTLVRRCYSLSLNFSRSTTGSFLFVRTAVVDVYPGLGFFEIFTLRRGGKEYQLSLDETMGWMNDGLLPTCRHIWRACRAVGLSRGACPVSRLLLSNHIKLSLHTAPTPAPLKNERFV